MNNPTITLVITDKDQNATENYILPVTAMVAGLLCYNILAAVFASLSRGRGQEEVKRKVSISLNPEVFVAMEQQAKAEQRTIFPTDDSLFKILYLAMIDITKKWTGKSWDWGQTLDQLCIYFGDRIQPGDL